MPGPNTWMSTPTPIWSQVLKHLGPTKFQLHRLKTKGDAAAFNPAHGLSKKDIPGRDLVEIRNFSITGRDGEAIQVRSYTPVKASRDNQFPVLTWGHHGGWKLGNLDTEDSTCRYISAHCGFVVVNIGYALVPRRFPTALNNIQDVIRWVAENHNSIRVDPTQGFIIGGASAGANMSAVVAHLEKDKLPVPITGQLFSVGWFLDQKHKHKLDVPQAWIDELTSVEDNKDMALISKETIEAILAPDWLDVPDSSIPSFSPCLFPKESFQGLPPAYIQIAGQDPFRDDGFLYAKQLERGGARIMVRSFPGVPHAWFEFPQLPETRKYIPDLAAGVKWLQEQRKVRLTANL